MQLKGSQQRAIRRRQTYLSTCYMLAVQHKNTRAPEPCRAQIELIEGVNKHVFGEGLDVVEQQWLVSEINGWLEGSRGSPIEIDTTEDRAQVLLPAS